MTLLESIAGPEDLKRLDAGQMEQLAGEIRAFLISNVSATGGHLGPNLGVVELTMAVHRVFSSPTDSVVFDTGHQSYVHKLLTGRQDFSTLRQEGGLTGYPSRAESEHDIVESSHASSSLSWADGISRGYALTGQNDRHTVAVIGDGALTGGMAWEAVNNIASDRDRKVVIVVNDNGRSYAPTVGGFANHLKDLQASVQQGVDAVRTDRRYEQTLDRAKHMLTASGHLGQAIYRGLHGMKQGIKDVVVQQGIFEDLGMKYVGPVDGHDLAAMEQALTNARNFGGPVIVHAITEKGHGYLPARLDENDQFHSVPVIDPETGKPTGTASARTWTHVFRDEIAAIADDREDVVGITGAMLIPMGLQKMQLAHPDRVVDVGIAEQHALTMAAGMAFSGLHPVVGLYATFLNRGFDQLLMDVALHRAGVTVVLDRAGVTGPDGPSHHGMWDLALLQIVPGLHLAAPRDEATMVEELREAVAVSDAPTVVRYPKGPVGAPLPALERLADGVDVLARSGEGTGPEQEHRDVLIVGVGAMCVMALDVSERLAAHGVSSTVLDPRWVLPVADSVVETAARHRIVVVIEDGVRAGGIGSLIRQQMRAHGVDTALNEVGLPTEFLEHASRDQILRHTGLTAQRIAQDTLASVLGTKVPYARPAHDDAAQPLPASRTTGAGDPARGAGSEQ
ncbi:1-deoxy-D-xylulose-5-phosphate synthase [Kocuria rhizophila]|uniref:1-deoxy-D-xylulose-5-phosphate synthase n=1 Tax=Kocuria rhizophila TaxID=72000 RepID=UPI000C878237|nr:1-deoxy-D-xylulose-5-phosphate synthase [Kocuria rhizophila]MCT1957749.1 1-deoxy-D-xylulose-5-phosphate synthase [Kocuria rhizophila]MCT2073802.1 1-deoxy-D-xylulose-5-phosphate synthase [Kocuria rhizophila]PMR89953.1 1-deoxy-D-xylulose-5-phosphate synthase [Kocuria rhizophila]